MHILLAFALFLVSCLDLSGAVLQPVHKQQGINLCSFVAVHLAVSFHACSTAMSLPKLQNLSVFLAS